MSRSKPEELLAHELSCPICFQLFTDPVVLPCGHNYCRRCIEATASTAVKIDGRAPQCPECRLEFHDVDTLQRNFKLCSIIEGFKAGQTRLIPNDDRNLEAPDDEEVLCDHCIDEASPATKACLKCEVSLCSRHFQKHQEKESFRTHRVVDAQRAERATPDCATHRRSLEYFCSSDMNLLCAACFIEGRHQNHDVLSFGAAEEEMRRALESRTKVVSSRLQMTQGLLQKTVEEQGACEAIGDKLCKRAVCLMDDISALADRYKERLRELLEEERGQRRKSWHLGLGALEQQQIRLLEAQHCATEALRETDACTFIQRFVQIEQKMREAATNPLPSQLPAKAPLNTKRLQANLKTQDFRSQMSRLVDSLHILLNPLELTFNVCTCHPCLVTSADLRTVRYSGTKQPYQEHPERFTIAPQVLCSQGFSGGEHVWVVDVGASAMWSLGVCYKTIPRRGDHSRLGHNSVSWRLQWKNGKLTVCQSSCNVALGEMANQPLRIEVALDCDAGTLTFHNVVKERREHLYTFRTVFREAVYPAFSIHSTTAESWITLRSEI